MGPLQLSCNVFQSFLRLFERCHLRTFCCNTNCRIPSSSPNPSDKARSMNKIHSPSAETYTSKAWTKIWTILSWPTPRGKSTREEDEILRGETKIHRTWKCTECENLSMPMCQTIYPHRFLEELSNGRRVPIIDDPIYIACDNDCPVHLRDNNTRSAQFPATQSIPSVNWLSANRCPTLNLWNIQVNDRIW